MHTGPQKAPAIVAALYCLQILTEPDKNKEGDNGVKERSFQIDHIPQNEYFYFTKNDYFYFTQLLDLCGPHAILKYIDVYSRYIGIAWHVYWP